MNLGESVSVKWTLKFKVMCNFIEDYLNNPSLAVAKARRASRSWFDQVDDEAVYAQLSTPQFALYTEMISAADAEDLALQTNYKRLSL